MRFVKTATVIVLVTLVVVLSSACGDGETNTTPATLGSSEAEVVKPEPVILGISASTTGMFDSYYTIVDVTLRNDGADGMVILVVNVSQASQTTESELPLYLARNITEIVRAVLPLKWRGGDWTPSAEVEIP